MPAHMLPLSLSPSLPFALGIDFDMQQAVGEKQEGERQRQRHVLHMVHVGPCNLKSTDRQ